MSLQIEEHPCHPKRVVLGVCADGDGRKIQVGHRVAEGGHTRDGRVAVPAPEGDKGVKNVLGKSLS